MAKKAKKRRREKIHLSAVQRKRLGTDIEALGMTLDKRDVEIRFDITDPDTKRRIEMLSRYGLVRVRKHGDGGKLWRVALTDDGYRVGQEHYRRVKREGNVLESAAREDADLLSAAELQKRTDQRNDEFAAKTIADGKMPESKGGIQDISLPPDPILITTQSLRQFVKTATEKGMSRLLTAETLDQLDPNGKHRVMSAWKHTSDDGRYKNARLRLHLYLKHPHVLETHPDPEKATRDVMCDISLRDWDMLMVPHQHKAKRMRAMPGSENVLYLTPPKWAGTRSFESTYQLHAFYHGHIAAFTAQNWVPDRFRIPAHFGRFESGEYITLNQDDATNFIRHPRSVMNAEACEMLDKAHPIVIDPEWVEIQEDWTQNEAWAFAENVVLPFDPIYLDFEGPGGRIPEVVIYQGHENPPIKIGMIGCLIWTDRDTGRLIVNPIGGRQFLDPVLQTHALAGGYPYEQVGRVVMGGRCGHGQPFPVEIDGEKTFGVDGLYVIPTGFATVVNEAVAMDLSSYAEAVRTTQGEEGMEQEALPANVEEPERVPGYIELPLHPSEALNLGNPQGSDDPMPWFEPWAKTTVRMSVKALSMLALLDNEHVEIREAQMNRAGRREVERTRQKGGEIDVASEIVVIRNIRYEGNRRLSEAEGRQIEYSHQFPVRRHEQHHGPHTPAYRAHPEKAKPCARCGSCRRFIVDSYIKGDPSKPLKAKKTYVYRENEQ